MYISSFLFSFFLSLLLVLLIKKFFGKGGNLLRFGGVAIILSFVIAVIFNGYLVLDWPKIGILISSILILACGLIDDIFNLSWKKQLVFQLVAIVIVVAAGVSVDYVTNPFSRGDVLRLDMFKISIGELELSIIGSLFITFWLLFLMNAVNWLDGVDGLAGGVSLISAATLFFLSVSATVNQPSFAIIAAIIFGSVSGFMIFNFPPAKILMGTSGSVFLGFIIGILAIFSGGKIATTMMVLGLPIFDALWVIFRRFAARESIFKGGDRRHFHYRLQDMGWSSRQILFFYSFTSALLGALALSRLLY